MKFSLESNDISSVVKGWISGLNSEFWADVFSIPLQIAARDEENGLVGGALGEVRYGILHINYVALAPAEGRRGQGARLQAALKRKASKMALSTRSSPRWNLKRRLNQNETSSVFSRIFEMIDPKP